MLNRVLGALAQVLAAVVIVAGLLLWLNLSHRRAAEAALPPGWLVIQPPREVSSLVYYQGLLIAGGIDGLLRIDRATGARLDAADSLPETGYVFDLLVTTAGRLWVAAEDGIYIDGDEGWQRLETYRSAPAYCLLELGHGDVMWGADGGIMHHREGVTAAVDLGGLEIHQVNVLYRDEMGVIWAGCNTAGHGRLLRYAAEAWTEITPDAGLPHQSINAFATDARGRLWAGTGFAGLGGPACRVDGTWRAGAGHPVVDGGKVRSLYRDSRGRFWFGMEYDGVIISVEDGWLELTEADGLAGREVKVVLEDTDDVYWVGTDRGLNRIVLP